MTSITANLKLAFPGDMIRAEAWFSDEKSIRIERCEGRSLVIAVYDIDEDRRMIVFLTKDGKLLHDNWFV